MYHCNAFGIRGGIESHLKVNVQSHESWDELAHGQQEIGIDEEISRALDRYQVQIGLRHLNTPCWTKKFTLEIYCNAGDSMCHFCRSCFGLPHYWANDLAQSSLRCWCFGKGHFRPHYWANDLAQSSLRRWCFGKGHFRFIASKQFTLSYLPLVFTPFNKKCMIIFPHFFVLLRWLYNNKNSSWKILSRATWRLWFQFWNMLTWTWACNCLVVSKDHINWWLDYQQTKTNHL